MPTVRITQPISLRSEPLARGALVEVDDLTARQLIEAGQAEPVKPAPQPKSPQE